MLFGLATRFPLGGVKPDYLFGRLVKGRCLAGAGVVAFFDGLAVSQSPPAGLGEGYCRVATQPEVGYPVVDPDLLSPRLGKPSLDLGRFDQQTKPMPASTVAIATRLAYSSNECGRKC